MLSLPRTVVRHWKKRSSRVLHVGAGLTLTLWAVVLVRQHQQVQTLDDTVSGENHALLHPSTRRHHRVSSRTAVKNAAPGSERPDQAGGAMMQNASNRKQHEKLDAPFAAFFNTIPLTIHREPLASSVHCIGTPAAPSTSPDDDDSTWMYRSCRFDNLCFDTQARDYVLVRGNLIGLDGDITQRHFMPADNTTHSVALGGINPRWNGMHGFNAGAWKVKWFPRIIDAQHVEHYYRLPSQYVLIPFHSLAGHNVGHLVWDDFYPIFSMLQLFGMDRDDNLVPLLIRQVLSHALFANCDIRKNKRQQCAANFEKLLPLLGVDPRTFSTSRTVNFTTTYTRDAGSSVPPAQYVCATTGLAGIGMLTDHGLRDHGWQLQQNGESMVSHNLGRSAQFWAFRKRLVNHHVIYESKNNLGSKSNAGSPLILFSTMSSQDWDRRFNFSKQVEFVRRQIPESMAQVKAVALWEHTLQEQIELALQTRIFITACGGGSMTATFVPWQSTLIAFYNPRGGFDYIEHNLTYQPARLDWDLVNNAGHLRTHWLPTTSMDDDIRLELLALLISHDLALSPSIA